jgi:(p)ppGpp synthase/HD superfamily hydrolase
MQKPLSIEFEKAINFLTEHMPPDDENSRKPIVPHDIRVGTYLYENGYKQNIVLAGLLHDTIEWSKVDAELLKKEFGASITKLVLANTKNTSIDELIERCAENGQDALIIKAADIIDSFKWYTKEANKDQLQYCADNAKAIFKYKPDNFEDKIFDELKTWLK